MYLISHLKMKIELIEKLKDFEILLVMRERTPITKKIISNLKKVKTYNYKRNAK
jgi:hypothetical protein